jgi:nitroreductase
MSLMTKDVWEICEQDFPGNATIETQLRFLLGYAILAPSTRNTQPWRFAVEVNTVHLFADFGRGLRISDPDGRQLYISLGCALENLLVAAEYFGFRHEVRYFPERGNAELAASVVFAPGVTWSPARCGITLDAIVRRHNHNGSYRPLPVPEEVRRRLRACREESELRLDLTDDRWFRRWVDGLTREADRLEFADPAFRKELGYWIGQGVFGMPRVVPRLGGLTLLGLVSATSDTHLAHVRTGQLFERLWLAGTAVGVSVHPMSQTMRLPKLRAALAELVPDRGWKPQHLFRVRYSSKEREPYHHTPRRPLGAVLPD